MSGWRLSEEVCEMRERKEGGGGGDGGSVYSNCREYVHVYLNKLQRGNVNVLASLLTL